MKEIRKKIIKIVSIVLAAAMIGTSSGLLAFAAQGGNDNNTSSYVSDSTETGSSEKSSSEGRNGIYHLKRRRYNKEGHRQRLAEERLAQRHDRGRNLA